VLRFKIPQPENLLPEEDLMVKPAVYEEIPGWDYKKKYRISFDYKIVNKEAGLFVKLVTKEDKNEDSFSVKSIGEVRGRKGEKTAWEHFEKVVEADYGIEKVGLYIYTDAGGGSEIGEVRNVAVRKVLEPTVVLRKIRNTEPAEKSLPKITFSRINPTKYQVKVEGARSPYTLIFNESFHEGWKVSVGQSPIDVDHLLVNGYANSWYIEPEDVGGAKDYELMVEFWPQRLLDLGLALSLTSLLGCLGYLGYWSFLRRFI
jgi:hypothetical protein